MKRLGTLFIILLTLIEIRERILDIDEYYPNRAQMKQALVLLNKNMVTTIGLGVMQYQCRAILDSDLDIFS